MGCEAYLWEQPPYVGTIIEIGFEEHRELSNYREKDFPSSEKKLITS